MANKQSKPQEKTTLYIYGDYKNGYDVQVFESREEFEDWADDDFTEDNFLLTEVQVVKNVTVSKRSSWTWK